MSTRGAYGFYSDGKFYMFFHGHDSYPNGLGITFFEYLKRNKDKLHLLKEKLKTITNIENNDDGYEPMINKLSEKYPNVNKDILKDKIKNYDYKYVDRIGLVFTDIINNEVGFFVNDKDFINNSLFCEYYYYYDLDNNVFSVGGRFENDFSLEDELEWGFDEIRKVV